MSISRAPRRSCSGAPLARVNRLRAKRAATVEEANSHRSYKVGGVTRDGLSEQQKIADIFQGEGLIPNKVDASAFKIWQPN